MHLLLYVVQSNCQDWIININTNTLSTYIIHIPVVAVVAVVAVVTVVNVASVVVTVAVKKNMNLYTCLRASPNMRKCCV